MSESIENEIFDRVRHIFENYVQLLHYSALSVEANYDVAIDLGCAWVRKARLTSADFGELRSLIGRLTGLIAEILGAPELAYEVPVSDVGRDCFMTLTNSLVSSRDMYDSAKQVEYGLKAVLFLARSVGGDLERLVDEAVGVASKIRRLADKIYTRIASS